MTDFNDDFEDADESEAKLAHELRTRGAWIAYRTNIDICQNSKNPANARAQAAASLLRAGGFFSGREGGEREKELSEMTQAEIGVLLRKTETALEQRLAVIGGPPGSLFD